MNNADRGLSRRGFLKLSALVIAGAMLPGEREKLRLLPSVIVAVDMAYPRVELGVKQTDYPDNEELIRKLAGDEYISREQVIMNYGFNVLRDRNEFAVKFLKERPRAATAYGAME